MIFKVKSIGPGLAHGRIFNDDIGFTAPCALGKNGIVPERIACEGDGATPAGIWSMRELFYRADKITKPVSALKTSIIKPQDGWCDESNDPNYNRPVRRPYPASSENMWRRDHLYDVVVPLGFNDDPVTPGKGSAIFLHQARPAMTPTLGCVALHPHDLRALLRLATKDSALHILL